MTNKTILIVGGATGFGKILALELATSNQIYVFDNSPKLSETFIGTNIQTLRNDLMDIEDDWDHIISIMSSKGVDGIVYCVRGRERYDFDDLEMSKFRKDFQLNFECFLLLVHGLKKYRLINDNASIVNFSSFCGPYAGAESCSYHVSKSSLESLSKYLAKNLGSKGIRINTLQLGFIVKDEYRDVFYSEENKEYRYWAEKIHPLKRVGHNNDVTGPIKFLLSDESSFITGQTITVDGGLSIQEHSLLVREYELGKKGLKYEF